MRVYTVTYLNQNYGSLLQAYALQAAIKQQGATPIILRVQQPAQTKRMSLIKIRHILTPRENYSVFQNIQLEIHKKRYSKKNAKLNRFIHDRLAVQNVSGTKEASALLGAEDILLAGSDQIWSMIDHPLSKWYTFQWEGIPESIKQYSYAASIGLSDLNDEQIAQYRAGLDHFTAISFRERQAYETLSPYLSAPTRFDLDPTLLHDQSFWSNVIADRLVKEPYVFVYMLRPDKRLIEMGVKVAKARNCKVIYTGLMGNTFPGVKTVYDAGVEGFLSYIKHAEAIITNSFHGTVFSLLFEKQFVSVRITSTSSRVENLLEIVALQDRCIDNESGLVVLDKPIDYKTVHSDLQAARMQSLAYLRWICTGSGNENEMPGYSPKEKITFFESKRSRDCRGCGACVVTCPVHAIELQDKKGFCYPEINHEQCIHCGLCRKVCSKTESAQKALDKANVYYGWNTDPKIRWESTSGGAFPAIAKAWLQEHAGGRIYGAVFDDEFHVKHIGSNRWDEIMLMCRSKYVQSDLTGVYEEIRELLKQKQFVLFSGTPCQVAGLLAVVGTNNPYLFTVDFICHGVSNPYLLQEYIRSLGKRRGSAVTAYSVRNKVDTPQKKSYRLVRVRYADGFETLTDKDAFIMSYKYRLFYRKSCYGCIYASMDRCSDITMGDFWGIENAITALRTERLAGISMVTLNTEKARSFMSALSVHFTMEALPQGLFGYKHLFLPTYSMKPECDTDSIISSEDVVKAVRACITPKERFIYTHPQLPVFIREVKRRLLSLL